MTDPTDVLERAQAWLQAADERGINRTDKDGYLSVIEDLVAEVEFQRVALQGYRNRQIELTDELAAAQKDTERLKWVMLTFASDECREVGGIDFVRRTIDAELDKIDADRESTATDIREPVSRAE